MVERLKSMKKHVSLFSTLLFTLALIAVFQAPRTYGQHPGPYYKVEPETITFGPDPAINQTFTVAVWLHNVTDQNVPAGVFGIEIKLQWNPNLIEFVNRTLYIGVEGGVLNGPYFTAKDELTNTTYPNDTYWIAASSLAGADPWFGDGKVAEFTFKVIYQPKWYEKLSASCPLQLIFTDLVDATATPVPHEREDGFYEILAPETSAVIKVEPAEITFGPHFAKNQTFDVEINLYNVKPLEVPNGTYGVEIKFSWNATLLEYVSHELMLGLSGGVLNEPLFVPYDNVTIDGGVGTYWLVATSYQPAEYWYGNGTIVKFTFRVAYQGWEPEPAASSLLDLEFTDIVMPSIPYAKSIPHAVEDGLYEILPLQHVNSFVVSYLGSDHIVTIESDGAIIAPDNLGFDPDNKQITFNVTYADGYCNVTIPKNFMWCDVDSDWTVIVDGTPLEIGTDVIVSSNETHTSLWFNFTEGDHVIVIQSTNVIPEFSPALMILAMLSLAAIPVIIRKRKK